MAGNPVLLIVDDSRVMRVSLKKILKEDFEVIEAVDGEDAWDKLQAEPGIQGIFSDLSMPNLDGYGLLERVRGSDDARIRELPFIVITGKEGELDDLLAEVKDRGANDLVGKPFKSDDIIQRTKSFLAAEAEAQRKAEEEAARLRVEQERRAAEEQARREAAEAQRRAEEQQRAAAEAAQLRAEQERQAAEVAERQRLAAEEQARREAEEAARLRAEQERQAAEAAERQRLAEEQMRREAEKAARLAAEQARREAAEAAKRAEEEAEQARLAAQEAARIRAEEQKQVEKFREAARLAAEAREREEEARLRFGPAQAFFVRLALPFMEWTNKIFRRNRDEQIAALKKRLPK